MGKTYTELHETHRAFIERQRMFFVATAPRADGGHINLSPKGLDSFRVLSPTRVGYADFAGSGVETIAHLRENGRMTIMFCAFDGPPNILRLYGRGRVVEPQDAEFSALAAEFPRVAPLRSVIVLDLTRVYDSCGFAVPLYEFKGDRDQLTAWCERKGEEAVVAYQRENNARSIDGLPGLRWAGTNAE